jgi:hypothetical protein
VDHVHFHQQQQEREWDYENDSVEDLVWGAFVRIFGWDLGRDVMEHSRFIDETPLLVIRYTDIVSDRSRGAFWVGSPRWFSLHQHLNYLFGNIPDDKYRSRYGRSLKG